MDSLPNHVPLTLRNDAPGLNLLLELEESGMDLSSQIIASGFTAYARSLGKCAIAGRV